MHQKKPNTFKVCAFWVLVVSHLIRNEKRRTKKLMNEQNIKIKTVPHFWPPDPVEKRASLFKVVECRLPTWLVQKYLQQTICTRVTAHKMSPGNGNKQLFLVL